MRPMGIRRVTSNTPCLVSCLVMRAERSFLKIVSGASKFISVMNSMKLQSKVGGIMSVKTELFKGSKV
eukprot:1150511-Pelagomonas_calceolata.AAC.3